MLTSGLLRRMATIGLCSQLLACMSGRAVPPPLPETIIRDTAPDPLVPSTSELQATRAATERLKRTLAELASESRFAFGHEDSTAYGIGWSEEPDRSDIKSICDAHPAVYGWDLFRIEIGSPENGDGVNFDLMRRRIQAAHRLGGINTISWHVDNPVSGGDAWDTARAVGAVIPGGTHHELYTAYLDRVANFLQSCRGDQGELIPIIFRPFHEHTGSWFWWGASHATDQEFVSLWRFTIDYLRKQRGFEHLLFAFSPGGGEVDSEQDYLFRYPGDDYVDVMGIDYYYDGDVAGLVQGVSIAVKVARARNKVAALTEFGLDGGLSDSTPADWFSRNFFQPLVNHDTASRIAYALAWRNANPEHFFVPFPGHQTAADFQSICSDPRLLLQRDLPLEP